MPHSNYAASAPATDRPYQELEDFPTVAAIARKVKMNPLAASFSPSSIPRSEILSKGSVTTEVTPASTPNTKEHPHNEYGISSDESFPLTWHPNQPFPRGQPMEKANNAGNPSHLADVATFYQSDMQTNDYDDAAIPPEHAAYAAFTPYQGTSLTAPNGHQQYPMSGSLVTQQDEHYLPGPPDHVGFDYQLDPRSNYQDDAMQPHSYLKPSPFHLSPTQTYPYYPTHLYSRALPLLAFRDATRAYEHDYRIGPLPPSYPFSHLTPPDRPLNQQAPHRFPRPYDNTAKATAYLRAFTALYGYSTTSLNSLHALCLTLGHPNSVAQCLPKTIRRAQNFLKARYVNIFDLVDYGMRGEVVPAELVFATTAQLRRYSEDTKKICPASVGRIQGDDQAGNELWRWMLRKWY